MRSTVSSRRASDSIGFAPSCLSQTISTAPTSIVSSSSLRTPQRDSRAARASSFRTGAASCRSSIRAFRDAPAHRRWSADRDAGLRTGRLSRGRLPAWPAQCGAPSDRGLGAVAARHDLFGPERSDLSVPARQLHADHVGERLDAAEPRPQQPARGSPSPGQLFRPLSPLDGDGENGRAADSRLVDARGRNNHWVFYPRLSRDGQTVFYAYDQKDGFGSYRVDLAIFATPLDSSGRATVWTRPNEYTGGDVDPVPLGDGGLIYTKYSNDDSFQVHSQIWIQRRGGRPGVAP